MSIGGGIAPAFAVDEITSGSTYYIQNVSSGKYLAGANSWGTQASVVDEADQFKLTLSDGKYSINNQSLSREEKYCNLGSGLYTDDNSGGTNNIWTIAAVSGEDGVFTIAYDDNGTTKYLAQSTTAGTYSGYITESATEITDAAKWYILTKDEAVAKLANATEANPISATFLIGYADFSRNHANTPWSMEASNKNLGGGDDNNYCCESYHSVFTLAQTITVPNGKYKLSAQGFYRQDGSDNDNLPYFYLNDAKVNLPLKTGSENSMSDASASFTSGSYKVETDEITVTDGTIKLGVKNESNEALWCIWDNFDLTYYGPITDYTTYATSLSDLVTKATAIKDEVMNGTVKTALTTAISTYSDKTKDSYSTEAEWTAAINAMTTAYNNANTSVSNYATAKTYLDAASSLDEAGKASYAADATVSAVQKAYDDATLEAVTSDQITAMNTALATAAKAQTTAGSDMTAAIVNPTINGSDGWTAERPNGGNGPLLNNVSFEYWGGNATGGTSGGKFDYYQEITGLPAGKYTVSAEMYNSTNGESGATFSATSGVYASSAGSEVYKLVDVDGTTLISYTTDEIAVTNGTLRIGVKNEETMTARWFVADNFKLTFVEAVSLDDYYTQINTLVTSAKAVTGTMSNAASTALSSAITAGETATGDTKETSIDKLTAIISDLQTAISDANASVKANKAVADGVISTESIDGWTCSNSNTFHVNTWSSEGTTDGSNMITPFLENWVGKGSTLGEGEITYELTGLVAGTYYISAYARVLNEAGGAITGASFFVNDNTMNLSTETGAQACTNGIYEGVYQSATVEDNGTIKLGFKLTSPTFNWISFKDVKVSNDITKVSESVTVGESGWATYSASTAVDYSKVEGLTAYTAKYDAANLTITLTPVAAAVPANTAVVLKGTASTTYTLTPAASGTAVSDNDLKASNNTVTANGTQWCLTTMDANVGFAPVTSGVVIPAKKAYLVITDAAAAAKGFIAIGESAATGINGVAAESVDDGNVYNVAGQKVSSSYKGLVIKNGKKYLRK